MVNGPAPQRCGGTLARMGLGGILGGVAGRYAVGGRKSDKTILGTSIGAAAGARNIKKANDIRNSAANSFASYLYRLFKLCVNQARHFKRLPTS